MLKRIAVLLLALALVGCSAPKPAKGEAEVLVAQHLQAKVDGDFDKAFGLYVPAQQGAQWARTPAWTQWAIVSMTEAPDGWLFETREYRYLPAEPNSSVMTGYYLVVNQKGQAMLDVPFTHPPYNKEPDRYTPVATWVHPLREDPQTLEVQHGGMERVALIAPKLPDRFRPGGVPENPEFAVDRTAGYGALAISPDTKRIAFVTRGTHAFLGVTDYAGSVTPLDLWFEGSAGELVWSLDGKYLASTAVRPHGGSELQVWEPDAHRWLPVAGGPAGGPDLEVSDLQWRWDKLYFSAGGQRWEFTPGAGARQL